VQRADKTSAIERFLKISDEDAMISDSVVPPKRNFYTALSASALESNSGIPGIDAIAENPLAAVQNFTAKMLLDYALGSAALILFAPLLLAIALAVKLDSPGPVLFRQPRRGLNGRPFELFKFRSMHVHPIDPSALNQTFRDDPRVTRVGRWLRRFSLDELPQLFNVLRGEMSLVGPRPHALNTGELLPALSPAYTRRYSVKPGITGWAQVNGARGALASRADLRRRIVYDLIYIQNRSVGFDLKIIALTATREIISKSAF
jgi:exopolysaccharide biosynthesis polyprenyl glycosylphosphotransferase